MDKSKIIIFAIRNEHVEELPLYPYLTDDVFVVAENFNKKYGYLPNYVYVMKNNPGTMFVVANQDFTGDNNEIQIINYAWGPPVQKSA